MKSENSDILPVGAIKHEEEHRASIPTTELAGEETMAVEESMTPEGRYNQFRHEFNRGRDPELYWLGKYRNDTEETQSSDFRVDIRSLYRHEEISPEMLINQLYTLKTDNRIVNKPSLFDNEYPDMGGRDEIERFTGYYKYSDNWSNRLIQGDSLLVMNSLLKREGMAGKVQMVYIDPPYGIKYGSNWQMKLNSRDVKDNDESLSGEPEMIKAFRDTWELGIHSYLSYIRDRLVLARELLTESGSCFVQISDDNVHLIRTLMDEVFGSENFVSQIFYQKTTGAGSPGELFAPASVGDYILWYAKNRDELKYNKLFLPKRFGEEGASAYNKIELADGRRMSIADWEKENNQPFNYDKRPKNSNVYTLDNLTSQSGGDNARFPVYFSGKTFTISKGSWKTGKEGMERLIQKRRVDISSKGGI